jgi:hypothetical protein
MLNIERIAELEEFVEQVIALEKQYDVVIMDADLCDLYAERRRGTIITDEALEEHYNIMRDQPADMADAYEGENPFVDEDGNLA